MASNSPLKDTFTKRRSTTDKGKPSEDLLPALLTLKLTKDADVKDFQFTKRRGTTDKGKPYEDLLPALLTLKLTEDVDVKDFQLSANDGEFEAFDDIVLKVFYTNNKSGNYAVQLKHKEKNITRDMLGASRGPFSTEEYFLSYQKLKNKYKDYHYVLYTSGFLKVPDGFSFKLSGDDNLEVEIYKTSLKKDFLTTSDESWIYKFKIKNSKNLSKRVSEYEEFFKHYLFIPNQKKLEEAENLSKEIFCDAFFGDSDSFDKYLKYIQSWNKIEGTKDCINKEAVVVKLTEILLNPFLRCSSKLISDPCLWLFRDALEHFDVIIFESGQLVNEIFSLKEQRIRIKETTPIVICFEMDHEELIYKVVRRCYQNIPNKKIILFGNGIDRDRLPDGIKTFGNLHDLQNISNKSYKKFLKEAKISLQGREPVALSTLVQNDKDMKETFSTTELFRISKNHIRIGEKEEKLPQPYIEQYLLKFLINLSFLNSKTSSLIIVSCTNKVNLKSSGKSIVRVPKQEEEKIIPRIKEPHNNAVFIFEGECTAEAFQEICQNNIYQICYHFRLQADGHLELTASKGNVRELFFHLLPPISIKESEMVNLSNKINIIYGEAGTGKSTMIKYLKKHLPSNYWILNVSLRNYLSLFEEEAEPHKILQSLIDHQTKIHDYSQFECNLRNLLKKDKRIIVLWDGLDELTNIAMIQRASKAILSISKLVHAMWITTRIYCTDVTLVNEFGVLPMKIKSLDEKQEERYIHNYLENRVENVDIIVEKIKDVMNSTKSAGLLGFPLQIKILTELFYRNPEKYNPLINNTFTVTDMIYYFVEESIICGYKNRGGYNLDDSFCKQLLKEHRKYKIHQYEVLALQAFLSKEDFDRLPKIAFSGLGKIVKDDFGIVVYIDKNSITFLHNTVGEYFVASWFAKNFQNLTELQTYFFESRYSNIRRMFDIILSDKSPAHLAVLSNNVDSLLECKDDELDRRDRIGRSPLHIACSHGKAHPFLVVTRNSDEYEIDFEKGESVQADSDEYKKILRFLLNRYDVSEKDKYFSWNSMDYAANSKSLLPIDMILEKCKDFYAVLEDVFDTATLVFYSVKFNYINLFEMVIGNKIPYFESLDGSNLLHQISQWPGRLNFLSKILENEEYLKMIDKQNCIKRSILLLGKFAASFQEIKAINSDYETDFKLIKEDGIIYLVMRETPLHLASLFGNLDVVNILITKGANINSINNNGSTPLHYAASVAQKEIVQLLVENGATLNIYDCKDFNELTFAVGAGDTELVNYLFQEGSHLSTWKYHHTPLNLAVEQNNIEMIDFLMKDGKLSDLSIRAALGVAVLSNNYSLVEYFVKNRKHVLNETSTFDQIVLHLAIGLGNLSMVELFVNHKLNLESKDDDGFFPLHHAVGFGHYEIVKLLAINKANVNALDRHGHNCLHIASWLGNIEIMKLLLEFGCKINSTNCFKNTPLCLATSNGRLEAKHFLLSKGATKNKGAKEVNPEVRTALNSFVKIEDQLSIRQENDDNRIPIRFDARLPIQPLARILYRGCFMLIPEK